MKKLTEYSESLGLSKSNLGVYRMNRGFGKKTKPSVVYEAYKKELETQKDARNELQEIYYELRDSRGATEGCQDLGDIATTCTRLCSLNVIRSDLIGLDDVLVIEANTVVVTIDHHQHHVPTRCKDTLSGLKVIQLLIQCQFQTSRCLFSDHSNG